MYTVGSRKNLTAEKTRKILGKQMKRVFRERRKS